GLAVGSDGRLSGGAIHHRRHGDVAPPVPTRRGQAAGMTPPTTAVPRRNFFACPRLAPGEYFSVRAEQITCPIHPGRYEIRFATPSATPRTPSARAAARPPPRAATSRPTSKRCAATSCG